MARSAVLAILAANFVAVGVLYSYFSNTEAGVQFNLKAQAFISTLLPSGHPNCGLLKWEDYTITSNRVVFEDGIRPAAVHIVRGKISGISDDVQQSGPRVLSFKDAVIMPGVIDVHVHLNEPGRVEWEGVATGTRAAALGGITTVIEMPLNSQPTTILPENLKEKQNIAKQKSEVNIAHWAGLVPANADSPAVLRALISQGAVGFKGFMCPSGINDFAHVTGPDIAAALPVLKRAGVTLMLHAEVVSDVPEPTGDATAYKTYKDTRPPKFEQDAIQLVIDLLDNDTTPAEPGFSVHIAHLADATALPMLQEARKRHPITVETCAHYLTFHEGHIPDKHTWYKCAPPIRDEANMEALTEAVVSGDIDMVSSDHSPAPPDMKQIDTGNFLKAWGGISGVEYLLPATWTALKRHGSDLQRLATILARAPAKLAGLDNRKGKIAVGYDADIVVFEPEEPADTSVARNQHKHKISPYTDKPLQGKVVATIINGHIVSLFGGMGKQVCGGVVKRF